MMIIKSGSLFLLQSLILLCTTFGRSTGNETDKVALLFLKDHITQNPLRAMSSWNETLHFCEWEGVTCGRRHQRVIKLDLSSQGLLGYVSPYIGNLSFLRSINLRNNSLHGKIPQEIGRLFRLQVLLLDNNTLSGSIPVNLSLCSNLVFLNLGYNKLTGKIPKEFGSFPKIAELSLRVNNLVGGIPTSFGNLSSITHLDAQRNSLTGSIPDSLGKLIRIRRLVLEQNMFSGMIPRSIYNLSSLEVLSLVVNQLQGSLPPNMGLQLPNLTSLLIGGNKLSGSIPSSLFTNSSKLVKIEMSGNYFTGEVPIQVGKLKRLELLNLENNSLGSHRDVDDLNFITSLTNCSNLQALSIAANQFRGRLPSSVANLSTKLQELYLGMNQIYGSIPSDIGKLVNLIIFSIPYNFLSGTIPNSVGMLQNLQQMFPAGNKLSGKIPYSIGNLSSMYILDLSGNKLEGTIVKSIDKCERLETLNLADNDLTGIIPKEVLGLSTNLATVNLSYNNLIGSLPLEVGNLINLRGLDVSGNNISGDIPSTLGSCLGLEELYLAGNLFHGHIPPSIGYLKGIQEIDFSQNNLSGTIPVLLENLPVLQHLNLSFNNFEGEIPTEGVFKNVSQISIVGNDNLCGGVSQLKLSKCHIQKSKKRGLPLALKVTLGVVVPLFIISSALLALCSKKRSIGEFFSKSAVNNLPRISYNELCHATNRFSLDCLVGMGSYGSVYRGVLRDEEKVIAVKVLNLMERGASKSFTAECNVLRNVRHRNLLKILTVCSSVDFKGNDFKALVFEFMSNGNLENWLHPSFDPSQRPSKNLNLIQRLNISIDVASALDYLHNYDQTPIVHCDLKPTNVLLDNDLVAYVGDFGLAKFLRKNTIDFDTSETSSVAVKGTIGYVPPEYGIGFEVSTQGDMYSYGIMLLELFTGKRPTDEMFKDSLSLHTFCKINLAARVMDVVDMRLLLDNVPNDYTSTDIEEQRGMKDSVKECLISIIQIGVACSSERVNERMDIKEVLTKMHKVKEHFLKIENNEEI